MIRLYTDASLAQGVGGWAFVIVVPDVEPIEGSGRLRAELKCSTTAEARAVANALHRLARSGYAPPGTAVELYCDNRSVVERIERRISRRPHSSAAKAVAVVHKLAEDHGLRIKAKWIKGHRPEGHSEHADYNRRCDKLCKVARAAPPPLTKAKRALLRARALEGRK